MSGLINAMEDVRAEMRNLGAWIGDQERHSVLIRTVKGARFRRDLKRPITSLRNVWLFGRGNKTCKGPKATPKACTPVQSEGEWPEQKVYKDRNFCLIDEHSVPNMTSQGLVYFYWWNTQIPKWHRNRRTHSHHGKMLGFLPYWSWSSPGKFATGFKNINKNYNSALIKNNLLEAFFMPGIVKCWQCIHSLQYPCSTRHSVYKTHSRTLDHFSSPAVWPHPPVSPQIQPLAPQLGGAVRPSYQSSCQRPFTVSFALISLLLKINLLI